MSPQTINTAFYGGVTLNTPVTVTSAGAIIYNGTSGAAVSDGTGPGTLVNFGQINARLTGISLSHGGFVYNGAGGEISAPEPIAITGDATLQNAGRISGDVGIELGRADVTNAITGTIGVGIAAISGLVVNAGTIGSDAGAAVAFSAGGTVLNERAASLLGGGGTYAVAIHGAAGDIANQGTIGGVDLAQGGQVTNAGYIGEISLHYGINATGAAPGLVRNTGFVLGVGLQSGGTLLNAAGGTISGYVNGAYLYGGTLVNAGVILGVGGAAGLLDPGQSKGEAGVYLAAAGVVTNAAGGLIEGLKYGVWLASAAGPVTLGNAGTLTGAIGILAAGAAADTIFNTGLLAGTAGLAVSLAGASDLLVLQDGSTLAGTVAGGQLGGTAAGLVEFDFGAGGTVQNIGRDFVRLTTLLNAGTLTLSGDATLTSDLAFLNEGVLLTGPSGLETLGTLRNTGAIAGGVTLGVPDYIPLGKTFSPYLTNAAGAVITGGANPAILELGGTGDAAATLQNAGTIQAGTGGVAISFAAGGDGVLVIDPGSVIEGQVIGGGGTASLLELGKGNAVGTIAGIGDQFVNFADIEVAAGADWMISAVSFASFTDQGAATLSNIAAGAGAISLAAGATLALAGSVAADASIGFGGPGGVLDIADAASFYGKIVGFAPGETIDLAGLAFAPAGSVTLAGGELTVVENGATATVALAGSFGGEKFHLGSDGVNGTDVTASASVACFLKGTRIATLAGDVPVEALRIGDMVLSPDGEAAPVKWIGRRRYAPGLPAADKADVIPVRIAAGALGAGSPARDLYVSPLHGMFIDGFLVPAACLVNGMSVRLCPEITDIAYFHIETARHGLVLANGAAAETFIDHASRQLFENAEAFYLLYPQGALNAEEFFAPRLESGPDLERLRRNIALRAGVLLGQDEAADVVGYLESADRRVIQGWAYRPTQPHLPVRLDIVANGAVLARTVANLPRPDVRDAGFGHGRCGFSVTLPAPLPALRRHEISVRATGGAMLAGAPVVLDPGIAPELLLTGGLGALIAAAAKGGTRQDTAALGAALEAAGRQLQAAPARPVRRGGSKNLALVIDEAWPEASRDAGSNAVLSHMAALQALGYQVAFCASGGPPADAGAQAAMLALRAQKIDCYGQDGATVEAVIRALAAEGLALVYLHRLAAASAYTGLARLHAPAAKVVYAVADLHHLRLRRQAHAQARPELLLRANSVQAAEFWAMRMADAVITHSAAERDYLACELPMANVHVVPWAVPARGVPRDDGSRTDIAFIGGAGHAPNADAVAFLAAHVMPAVWAAQPDIRCLIIGENWPVARLAAMDPRMIGAGRVRDLAETLARARITVAPLRFGAGIKGKVLESFALGLPCVMTPIAAEGLNLTPDLTHAVADPGDFATRLLEIYTAPARRRRLRQAGRALLRANWSDIAVREAMAALVGAVQPSETIRLMA
jgi:glycosyltransferase involved in cell wall biosynthesis